MDGLVYILVFAVAGWLIYNRVLSTAAKKSVPPATSEGASASIINVEQQTSTINVEQQSGPAANGGNEYAAIEKHFGKVFLVTSAAQRTSIIDFYMTKYKCSRYEAMQRAIDDRRNDENRL
jgi:hypothetical protein